MSDDGCLSCFLYSKAHKVSMFLLALFVYSLSCIAIGAATVISGPAPPVLIQDGNCQPGSAPTQFRTAIEATGQNADVTTVGIDAEVDLFRTYLLDGNNTVLASTGHGVKVGTTKVFDPIYFVVSAAPSTGPFRIVVYEKMSPSNPKFAIGSKVKLDAALVRAELGFDANALDPDCPAASTRGGLMPSSRTKIFVGKIFLSEPNFFGAGA